MNTPRALLCAAILAAASPASAQRVRVDPCAAAWAQPEQLLPVLRVELPDLEDGSVLRVEVPDCDRPTALQLSIAREDRYAARAVELEDTPTTARARVLGLLLSDLYREVSAAVADDAPGEPTPRAPPGEELIGDWTLTGASPPRADRVRFTRPDHARRPAPPPPPPARPVLTLAATGAWAIEGALLGGASVGFMAPLGAGIEGPWIGAALDVAGTRGEDPLGDVDLVHFAVAPRIGWWSELGLIQLGAALDVRAGLALGLADPVEGVSDRTGVGFTLDVAALARLRVAIASGVWLGLEAGLGVVLRGYDARAEDRSVARWAGVFVPARLLLTLAP